MSRPAASIPPIQIPMELKPCRDCGASVQYTARSCPYCGIMNPVAKWVALPDGSDETHRVPVTAYSAMAMAARGTAMLSRPPRTTMERIFGPVNSVEEAKEAIDWCSGIILLLSAIQLLAALFAGHVRLPDVAILPVLAIWLRLSNSRIAAAVLLVVTVLAAVVFLMTFSLRMVMVWVIAAGLSWRAFKATGILERQG
jgi:hypothetical protein